MNELATTSPMVQLAELMLNADEARAQSDEEALRAARDAQQQALRSQVEALHDAADDVRVGAWVEGGATLAGGVMTAALLDSGQVLGQMASPLGRELGEAPSMDAQADAKQAEAEGADAGTRADMAYRHHERVRDDQDRVIATLQSILESESQGNLALIANV